MKLRSALFLSLSAALIFSVPAFASEGDYILENQQIADNESCIFTITDVEMDDIWGLTLHAQCVNKTDKKLMFTIEDASVDSYSIDPFWAEEVTAGKTANSDISFSKDSLEKCGIKSADEITFTLKVYDSDDWAADPFYKGESTIYPTGKTQDEIVYPEYTPAENAQAIVDNDQVLFSVEGAEKDDIWGYELHVYLENRTDKKLMYSWDDVSVNGVMSDPFWATTVPAGKKEYTDISFSSLDDDGVTGDVESIEFKLKIYDSDDFTADSLVEEVYTITPPAVE